MVIVGVSYSQTIKAYPRGGGSYRVSHDNLGVSAGLVAGASLSLDYLLTVAVSVAAGISALTSYLPGLETLRVPLCLLAVVILMLANLRGVKSSAKVMCLPTYMFLGTILLLVAVGLIQLMQGSLPALAAPEQQQLLKEVVSHHQSSATMAIGPVLMMRAFSSGCAALTGIEAISDSVMAFRPVE